MFPDYIIFKYGTMIQSGKARRAFLVIGRFKHIFGPFNIFDSFICLYALVGDSKSTEEKNVYFSL